MALSKICVYVRRSIKLDNDRNEYARNTLYQKQNNAKCNIDMKENYLYDYLLRYN